MAGVTHVRSFGIVAVASERTPPSNRRRSPHSRHTASLAGVAAKPIAIGSFGWIQVAGNCMCLTETNGAVAVVEGYQLIVGGTTGSLMPQATAVSLTVPEVGICVRAATTTDYSTVCLTRIE